MIQDPSISTAARVQHAVMLEHLQALYAAGEDYYHARNIVMAEHGPRIARECGKETAALALKVLCSYAEKDMPHGLQLQNTQHLLPTLSEELLTLQAEHGGKWVLPPRQRKMRAFRKRYGLNITLTLVFGPVVALASLPFFIWCFFILSKFDFWLSWEVAKWYFFLCLATWPAGWVLWDGGCALIGFKPINTAKKQTPTERQASRDAAKAELDRRERNKWKIMREADEKAANAREQDKKDAADLRKWMRKEAEIRKYAVPRIGGPHPSDRSY